MLQLHSCLFHNSFFYSWMPLCIIRFISREYIYFWLSRSGNIQSKSLKEWYTQLNFTVDSNIISLLIYSLPLRLPFYISRYRLQIVKESGGSKSPKYVPAHILLQRTHSITYSVFDFPDSNILNVFYCWTVLDYRRISHGDSLVHIWILLIKI